MPSFDVVCETDMQEMDNAVNQTHKEITTRYDFKGGNSSITLNDEGITIIGDDDYKLSTVAEILRAKLVRRNLDPKCLEYGEAEDASGGMKVQASIQGDQVRVTGKKRDDLQAIMALIRGMDSDRPLKFVNFRD